MRIANDKDELNVKQNKQISEGGFKYMYGKNQSSSIRYEFSRC